MINQWEHVEDLKCEYDIELLCLASGSAILKQQKIDPVGKQFFSIFEYKILKTYAFFLLLKKTNKGIFIINLFVLAICFRVIAYMILWVKGRRNFSINFMEFFTRIKNRVIYTV